MRSFCGYSKKVFRRSWKDTWRPFRSHVLLTVLGALAAILVGTVFAHFGWEHETLGNVVFGLAVLSSLVLLFLLFNVFTAPYRIHRDLEHENAALKAERMGIRSVAEATRIAYERLRSIESPDGELRSMPELFAKCFFGVQQHPFGLTDIEIVLFPEILKRGADGQRARIVGRQLPTHWGGLGLLAHSTVRDLRDGMVRNVMDWTELARDVAWHIKGLTKQSTS